MIKYTIGGRNTDLRLAVVKAMIVMGNIDYRRICYLLFIELYS